MRLRAHLVPVLGLAALLTGPLAPAAAWANGQETQAQMPQGQMPPQTLQQGFESQDDLRADAERNTDAPQYSAWLVESSRFMQVPFGAFMPDRAKEQPIDFPVNVGIIKGSDGQITLYDSGWQQQAYIFRWNNSCCFAPIRDQMTAIGLNPDDVTRIVVGHGHWDHSGQLDQFPNATLFIQKEELKAIDWALNYPNARISAWNTMSVGTGTAQPLTNTCARTPACGYPPQTVMQIVGKLLAGKAEIVDGRAEIAPGLIIHPAFRAHTYGSQLLQANTPAGQFVFGSDTYSSWEGIRDWMTANVQQTDTVQQFLAYEKCYLLTGTPTDQQPNNCIAAHERLSYSDAYPATRSWWNIVDASGNRLNCSRAAELVLANGEPSHVPTNPEQNMCVSRPSPLPDVSEETTNPGIPPDFVR